MEKELVIISGSNGKLGKAYLDYFSAKDNYDVVAFSRTNDGSSTRVLKNIYVDLLEKDSVRAALNGITFSTYKKVLLIHPVGKFKFQKKGLPEIDADKDGIDDEVFSSNVITLENILTPLVDYSRNFGISVTVCVFGSISDRYGIPYWDSYTKSKNILRNILLSLSHDSHLKEKFAVLFLNVSSVDTGNENKLRPYADKSYWLKPEFIVENSLQHLLNNFTGYREVDLYNLRPDFDPSYYKDNSAILTKWLREMGIN